MEHRTDIQQLWVVGNAISLPAQCAQYIHPARVIIDELGCKFPNELSSFLCKLGIGDSNTGNNLCHVILLEKDMRHIDSVVSLLRFTFPHHTTLYPCYLGHRNSETTCCAGAS